MKKALSILLISLVLISCQKEEFEELPNTNEINNQPSLIVKGRFNFNSREQLKQMVSNMRLHNITPLLLSLKIITKADSDPLRQLFTLKMRI